MLINEVAKLTGLSTRTLHYYHELGLVTPYQNESGYRIYTSDQLKSLEHIQFFKELGFSLKEIAQLIKNDNFNSLEAFKLQYQTLLAKQEHLQKQLNRLEQLIRDEQLGGNTMSYEPLDFDFSPYEQEAREKWGNKAIDESLIKLSHLNEEEKTEVSRQWNAIYTGLAKLRTEAVDHPETERLIAAYYQLLNKYFGRYDYNAFIGLGQLYVLDERFTANIDQYGTGLAAYMSEAMASWGQAQKK